MNEPNDERSAKTLEGLTAAWQQTTDALHDSERRYRELVEYSLGLICTHDLTGTILSINPAAARSLGYGPEDGIGRNLREFLSPATRRLFDEYLLRIQTHGHDSGLMRVVDRAGSERVWMYRNVLSNGLGGTYVLGHAIDVTERVTAERTLRLAQAELALTRQRDTLAFLANVSDCLAPLVTFDDLVEVVRRLVVPFLADWTMVHVIDDNGSFRYIPGIHADATKEPLLATIQVPRSGIDALFPLGGALTTSRVATRSADVIAQVIGAGESLVTAQRLGAAAASMLPLVVDGKVRGVLSLFSANARRYAAPDSLVVEDVARRIRLALDRIQLYREVQEANRLKDEFLNTLSHELRTPLNAIYGWARILRNRDLDKTTAHAVEVIERNADAQLRLIEEVLDVSRIMKGKMTLTVEPIDVRAIVRATIDTFRPAMNAKRIRLEERIGVAPPVIGDTNRLQQVFWNVLSNAVKFTGPDGGIVIALRNVEDAVEFEIEDTGVGIAPDVLPFVFDRFWQADSSTTRTFGGLGLGLTIVRHIVELHGGTVQAVSAGEGHGSTFTIRLPSAEREAAHVPASTGAIRRAELTTSSVLDGRDVLVVEDHDDARELIARVLEGAGARVLAASTTLQAVECAAAEQPDLLVADLGLPGEDGYVLLNKMRALYPGLPAIALTAYARASDRERTLSAGFNRHVIKPVDPVELVQIIAGLLHTQARTPEP
jgi:PAS domain S-box-containing protein